MRRRSERKKSTSPAPVPARRSRRSRKVSENDKTEDEALVQNKNEETKEEMLQSHVEEIHELKEGERASSEEHAAASATSPVRKSRSTRTTPKKRTESKSSDKKSVETIPEEEVENGADQAKEDEKDCRSPAPKDEDPKTHPIEEEEPPMDKQPKDDTNEEDKSGPATEEPKEEVKVPCPSISLTTNKDEEHLKTSSDVLDIQTEDVEERDEAPAPAVADDDDAGQSSKVDQRREKKKHKPEQPPRDDKSPPTDTILPTVDEATKENRKVDTNEHQQDVVVDTPVPPAQTPATVQRSVRKRKWLTNKPKSDRAPPVLAISTDSLKNIIADVVQPVPLSDVQLESSSEEEGLVTSDHESDEQRSRSRSISPPAPELPSISDVIKPRKERESIEEHRNSLDKGTGRTTPPTAAPQVLMPAAAAATAPVPNKIVRSPSPARNRASHVLYITNLVRPFTVLQLKGLLARTGKIVEEDGFWIDRIKSKCFVAYTTEDEAIETRHALHGVRWPVSNPKCLNVDFGSRTDMDRAIQSTKDEAPKYPHDNTRDNQQSGNTWSRLDASEKKPARPVREWDVGKKEPNDRDKSSNDRRRGSKERIDSRSRDADRSGQQERKRSRERERGRRDRDRSDHAQGRSRSGSPVSKSKKKENEPPIRLLDDLFRKTKGTPCIYWLPLTPEAIAEKEAFRQKRIEEHKQRIKEREERQKEREREKDRDRQRDTRRNRSNERRRSRSRERRRY